MQKAFKIATLPPQTTTTNENQAQAFEVQARRPRDRALARFVYDVGGRASRQVPSWISQSFEATASWCVPSSLPQKTGAETGRFKGNIWTRMSPQVADIDLVLPKLQETGLQPNLSSHGRFCASSTGVNRKLSCFFSELATPVFDSQASRQRWIERSCTASHCMLCPTVSKTYRTVRKQEPAILVISVCSAPSASSWLQADATGPCTRGGARSHCRVPTSLLFVLHLMQKRHAESHTFEGPAAQLL